MIERTPLLIAAEINMIQQQVRKTALHSAIEIGRRLREAKDLLKHGEWSGWLEQYVGFSQNKAAKLMRIYDAYGRTRPALPGNSAQAQAEEAPDLNYTQALIILGIPEQNRAEFLLDLDVQGLSTRELQMAVNERKRALEERDRALQEKAELQKGLDDEKGKNAGAVQERDKLKTEVDALKKGRQELEQKIASLRTEKMKDEHSYGRKAMDRMSNTLTGLYNKVNAGKAGFLFDNLERTFRELEYEVAQLAKADQDAHAMYVAKIRNFLVRATEARIGALPEDYKTKIK